jgi:L-ribulose-5-phosphate 3-epimerase
MLPGYNTNGFAHHKIEDALQIIAELGYRSVAFTLDYNTLEPFAANAITRARELGKMAQDLHLNLVIETGARFLLDPKSNHQIEKSERTFCCAVQSWDLQWDQTL